MNLMPRLCAVLLTTAALSAAAADSGKTLRAADMRAKPFNDAAVVVNLPASTPLVVLSRKGSWAQVQAGGKQGWIKVLNIITQSGKTSNEGLASASKALTTGSSGKNSSTAVRGFSKDDLKKAEPAPAEVDKLDKMGRSEADATAFARTTGLKEESVSWLPKGDN